MDSRKVKYLKYYVFANIFTYFHSKIFLASKYIFTTNCFFKIKCQLFCKRCEMSFFINNAFSRFIQNIKSWIQFDDLHKIVLFWEKPVLFEIMYSYFITILIIICEYKIHYKKMSSLKCIQWISIHTMTDTVFMITQHKYFVKRH